MLLNFWMYGCIHCLRALPDLEYLERKYADRPFLVIGIHTGKFDAEKKDASVNSAKGVENIVSALQRLDVRRPVV